MRGEHFDPFDLSDPFPSYQRLRAEAPVFYDETIGYWIVSRHADIKAVFEDWRNFSSENAQAPVRPLCETAKQVLKKADFTAYSGLSARVPPDHTRIRKAVSGAFMPRRYRALAPRVRRTVGWHTIDERDIFSKGFGKNWKQSDVRYLHEDHVLGELHTEAGLRIARQDLACSRRLLQIGLL